MMFNDFFKRCKAKNLSPQTIKIYRWHLNLLNDFLKEKDIKLENLNVDDFIIWLNSGSRSPHTIKSIMISVRTFLYFEMERGNLPAIKISLPKVDVILKETYTEEELEKLLKKPTKKDTFFTYRTWVLISYLMATGNRIGSTLEIKIKDVDFENGCVTLRRTKTRKPQIVPLTSSIISILYDYLKVRGGSEEDYLFCDVYGGMMTRRSAGKAVQRYNYSRGVYTTGLHRFRHTYATMFMKPSNDIYALSKLLGHTNISTTEKYVHLLPLEMSRKYEEFNPLNQVMKNKVRIKMK